MPVYKIETHMHTKEASACASASGAEMAQEYKSKGFDAIVITDHFFNGNCAVDRSLPWNEKVELYCKGYENAKAEGDKIGLKVFFGIEYNYNGAEFLLYNLSKEFLLEHPDIEGDVFHMFEIVHNAGGFIVQAHPFREANYLRDIKLYPLFVDGIEAFNIHNSTDRSNELAEAFADAYGLPKTGGSDLHHVSDEMRCGMEFDEPIDTIDDFIRQVCEHKGRIIRNAQ